MEARSAARPRPGHTRLTLTLTLDLDLGADPVAGVLTGGAAPAEPFVGWAGLTRAVELALAAERGGATPSGGAAR